MEWFSNEFAQEFDKSIEQGKWDKTYLKDRRALEDALYSLPKNAKILDLMCGSGHWTNLIYDKGYKNVIGLDFSKNMLAIAKKKNKKIKYLHADATNLPFKNETFDLIVSLGNSIGVVPGKENRLRAINEALQTLKPGKQFIYSLHNRWTFNNFLPYWILWKVAYHFGRNWDFGNERLLAYEKGAFGDVLFTWADKKGKPKGYTHIYSVKEAIQEAKDAGFKKVKALTGLTENWLIIKATKSLDPHEHPLQ